ncbi:hypothetical protein M9H77_03903 [Catharanthus roseus]|uniref:Uncharacterized protein n=1 Tax=Catharanthus roseus TaxID=4058 RepID=A0ACC0CCP9_CATRO|nr:hypothetical protein M9H77_03903 [Catharanthus roseus]
MKGNSHSRGRWFTTGLVSAWDASNIGVLLLNKYRLSNYGFKYPIFLTLCHMTACSLLSYIAVVWFKTVPATYTLIFCGSVVCGNVSLRYLPVSFTQAVGSTAAFFTALFAFLMTWKRENWLTYVTLIPVVGGVAIASGFEPSFHLFGFIMCIGATAARALKTVLGGILLSSEACWEKLSSMNLLLYMAPFSILFLFPAALLMEHNVIAITTTLYQNNLVLGNAKCTVAVVISILIFRNPVSLTGMLSHWCVSVLRSPEEEEQIKEILWFHYFCLDSESTTIIFCLREKVVPIAGYSYGSYRNFSFAGGISQE